MDTKKYLVAGGTSGIGLAIVKALAAQGHQIVTMSRNEIPFENANISHIFHDFSGEDTLPEIQGAIDGLFYCPGSIVLRPITRIGQKDLEADFRLNAVGAFLTVQRYVKNLQAAPGSGVVVFSSVAATTGLTFHTSISMAKGAVEAMTRSLAAELAPAVRVNCIAPSLVDTPLSARLLDSDQKKMANGERHPLKRVGTAEEIAALAVFVMQQATWVTGECIGINGGLSRVQTK